MRLRSTLIACMCFAAFPAAAQDKVIAKYLPAYPPPDLSAEVVVLEVTRIAGFQRTRELDIDRYFAAVERILKEQQVSPRWERVIVHAPSVHLEIVLEGKKVSLGSSYSAGGFDSFADPAGENVRHRRALEAILRLTTQHVSAKNPAP